MAVRIYMQQNMGLLHESRLYFFFVGFMLIQSLFGYSTKINNADIKCDGIHVNCKQGRYCFTFYHNGISYISALIYINVPHNTDSASLNTSRNSNYRQTMTMLNIIDTSNIYLNVNFLCLLTKY